MAELAERVARLEERFDNVAAAIADLKTDVGDLRSEMRSEFSDVRGEFRSEFAAVRAESAGIRADMNTQFRWLMGSIGTTALAILVAVLAAILATG